MDVLAALQNSIEIAGKLRTLAKKVEDADFKMLVADLSNELAEAKLEVATLKEELAEARTNLLKGLRAELDSLKIEKASMAEQLDAKFKECAALEQQVSVLTQRLLPAEVPSLDIQQEQILLALTKYDALTEEAVATIARMGKQLAAYHLEELRKQNFVDSAHFMGSEWGGEPARTEWTIAHGGREYLVRRKLLK